MKDQGSSRLLNGLATSVAVVGALASFIALVYGLGVSETMGALPVLDAALVVTMSASALLVIIVTVRGGILRRQGRALVTQRDVLSAAAFAAERLHRPDDFRDGLNELLARLGRAADASRVYLFENRETDGDLVASIKGEWCASGIESSLYEAHNVNRPYDGALGRWRDDLEAGRALQRRRGDVKGEERDYLDQRGVRAVTLVPIVAAGEWWGFLGLDECRHERTWEPSEIAGLRVTAATVGAALGRIRSDRAIFDAEERYRHLVEQIPAVIYIDGIDDTASTSYISPQIEVLTGYAPYEWMSDDELWPNLLHPDDRQAALDAVAHHNRTEEPFEMDYRLIAKDGRIVWVHDEALILRDANGVARSQGFIQDITAAKLAEEQLEYVAYHDALTGLPNQEMFLQLAELAIARAQRGDLSAAALFIDLDDFKLANDSLGTRGGDMLLRLVAERLDNAIRETDTLVRRGADEFLILLADLERAELGEMQAGLLYAESVAGRVRELLSSPFQIDGTEIFMSASVGISVFPDSADDAQSLLAHAESAMVQSKAAGPGGFAASGVGAVDSATKLAFVTRLRRAVEREEWELHYQPIVELANGNIKGVEALLRWRTTDGELIPPNEFIPLAEELGLIETMGDWVVEELVRQDAEWRADGLALEMGFNLSPRQFRQADLAERILSRLEVEHMDPRSVTIEITESSAMRDPERAKDVLWDLHSRGLRLALDDFGTGYSSLSRLRSLPIDVLKIDRSFVSQVDRDPEAAEIVGAFIQLGRGLGMTTLAEGIETESEWRFLAERGCELGQGFYFSRPVPASEISSRIRAGELVLARSA